ncbi:MAG: hypothetical protein RL141_76 [Candidatus Parcubacteria bacterium]
MRGLFESREADEFRSIVKAHVPKNLFRGVHAHKKLPLSYESGSFLHASLRGDLLCRFDTAGADAHTHTVHNLVLQVNLVAALGSDVGVAAGLARNRSALAAFTEFRHNRE